MIRSAINLTNRAIFTVQSTDSSAISTAYDTVWSSGDVPEAPSTLLEAAMLSNDKLFVVLAVVLIIWLGIIFLLLRTDRKLDRLERTVEARISSEDESKAQP